MKLWHRIEILLGGISFPDERNLSRSDFDCVSKEYEIKTKMEQEQWLQLKMLFLLGCNLKIVA